MLGVARQRNRGATRRRTRHAIYRAMRDLAAAIQRIHFFSAGRTHAHCARTRRRCALRLRAVPAGVGALCLGEALLLRNTRSGSLDGLRIVRIFTAGRVVTGLLQLNQFGANLCTGECRAGLRERHDRGNESGSNDNGLNERLHDDLPPHLSVFAVDTSFTADKPKFM